MIKGVYIKCRNCHKKYWTEFKLNFGARRNKMSHRLLDCLLNEVRFYFNCPDCNYSTKLSIGFFTDRPLKVTQITEDPGYIG